MYQSHNLALFFCLFMLVACGTSAPTPDTKTEADSSLIALVGENRTVSGSSLVIMGAVSEGGELSALSYMLGDGEARDVSSSIDGATFSFTVTGLVKGENTVSITAESGKKKHTLELSVTSLPQNVGGGAADLEGMWTATDSVDMRVCNSISDADLTFIFDAVQPNGSVGGLWHLLSSNETRLGAFNGNLDTKGKFNGSAVLIENNESLSFDLEFNLSGDKLNLALAATQDSYCDSYDYNPETGEEIRGDGYREAYEAKLERFEDDALESNNTQETATALSAGFDRNLVLAGGDEDWFSFNLNEASIAEFNFGGADEAGNYDYDFYGYDGPRLMLYRKDGSKVVRITQFGTSESGKEIGLNKGQYYAKIYSTTLKNFQYSLGFTTKNVPDSAAEPNDKKADASPLKFGSEGSYYLTLGDVDYYKFTLASSKLFSLARNDNQDFHFSYAVLAQNQSINNVSFDGLYGTSTRTLAAGTYYLVIRTGFDEYSSPYNFTAILADAPDANLEPNNTASQASAITLPFQQNIHVSSDDSDWFSFTLSEKQFVFFDANNDEESQATFYQNGSSVGSLSAREDRGRLLEVGTYQLKLKGDNDGLTYYLSLKAQTPSDVNDDNHSKETAKAINLGDQKNNLFIDFSDRDWYTFTLDKETAVNFDVEGDDLLSVLEDSSGKEISYSYANGPTSEESTSKLAAGTYYIYVESYFDAGLYSLSLNAR